LIPYKFGVIFIMDMRVKKDAKALILLISFASGFILGNCEAIDNILPSAGTYKINVQVNGISLDECSYVRADDKINLCFEEPVSDDPDVTAFMVFLKDSLGESVGWKVIYTLDQKTKQKDEIQLIDDNADDSKNEILNDDDVEEVSLADDIMTTPYKNGDELIIPVLSLDDELPSFPIAKNLTMGRYILVSQVMSGKDVLQKTEKDIFYLGKTAFSYEGINVYLPGTTGTSQFIPRGTVVMLEANLDFDKRLNPYIVWYEGKNKINEGNFFGGAGCLFWKAPEQSGFFSLRAEIFPVEKDKELLGYKKEISLLVSTKIIDMHLVSANNEQLTHWYVMEGNLNDSKMTASAERALKPASGTKPKWMGRNGTYGIATGYNNILMLPKFSVTDKKIEIWQTLFRFKLLNNGNIFSIKFGSSGNILLGLYMEGKNLVLTLTSPFKTVSQTVSLSAVSGELSENIQTAERETSFLIAGIKFSIQPGLLSAQINIIGNSFPVELAVAPIMLEAEIKNEFNIMLGFSDKSLPAQIQMFIDKSESSGKQVKTGVSSEYTVLWDEFALYYMPPKDILDVTVKPVIDEDKLVITAEN
jgi:hypothetical protein